MISHVTTKSRSRAGFSTLATLPLGSPFIVPNISKLLFLGCSKLSLVSGMGEQETQPRLDPTDSSKRKLDEIQLAKQKAQEIVARLVNDAEAKRPRLDDSAESASIDSSLSRPPFPDLAQKPSVQLTTNSQVGSLPFFTQPGQYHGFQGSSKRIEIPNGKVGVIIGKGGETIKYLQLQSGARIQVTKDTEADPYSMTRDVELTGTQEQITRAEQLIKDVIAETDAGGIAPSGNRGLNVVQPGAEQFTMKVPNNKVALLIGKGGETIKNMQSRSGARIQIIPLHLPPGDTSTERTVYINGLTEQIESAKELINEVMSENRLRTPSMPSSYTQQGYHPPLNWVPPGPPPAQPPAYGYTQPGTYPTQPQPYYGNYPPQPATWDQSNPPGMPLPPQQSTGYNYYGQQGQTVSAPPSSYGYGQVPPASNQSYDQAYAQQPQTYGHDTSSQAPHHDQQKPYGAPGYGPSAAPSELDGSTPSQPYGAHSSGQPQPSYPATYSQPAPPIPTGYGTPQSYPGPSPSQPGYDQMSYAHTGYGGGQQQTQLPPAQIPPTSQPVYGQGVYPSQPASAQASYGQATNLPVYGQSQPAPGYSQPVAHGYSQPLAYGAEKSSDGNSAPPGYGAAPSGQESARP